MAGEGPVRRGLEPVPRRIPPLPGTPATREPVGDTEAPRRAESAPPQPAPSSASVPPREAARQAGPRTIRPREFQLDKEPRDYIDSTVYLIRLRTDGAFDRSALVRGIVKAVRRSGLDLAAACATEEEVTEFLLRFLAEQHS